MRLGFKATCGCPKYYLMCIDIGSISQMSTEPSNLCYYIWHIVSLLLEVGEQQFVGSHDIDRKRIQSEK